VEARNEQNINSTKILTVMTGNIGEISLFQLQMYIICMCYVIQPIIHAYI